MPTATVHLAHDSVGWQFVWVYVCGCFGLGCAQLRIYGQLDGSTSGGWLTVI